MKEHEDMTDEQIAALVSKTAEEAARNAVREVFLSLGIKLDDAIEVQADMRHLRSWRQSVEKVKTQSLMSAVIVITTGVLGLIWIAVKGPTP